MSSIGNKGIMEPVNAESLAVVKIGGGLAGSPDALRRAAEAVAAAAARTRLVVVPGGGPFADAVRAFDATYGLSPSAGHWMAILAMDQYAFALADLIPGGRLVEDGPGIQSALASGAIPILAPSRWLRAADELPHRWDVTSDSLAAYLAMLLGADELILVKPVSGGLELVDPYFTRALPAGVRWRVVDPSLEGWG
jgi:aspartokinase-like uncharacterized kinase